MGMPVLAEMLPGGFGPEPPKTVETIRLAARIGAELGADIIKTSFVGSVAEYRTIVEGCFRPVVVLGGAKVKNLQDLFLVIEQAMEAGAKGVAIGRNVWTHPDPGGVTAALAEIVHGEKAGFRGGKKPMKAVAVTGKRKVEIVDVAPPAPRHGQVLIRIDTCLLCTWETADFFRGVEYGPAIHSRP